MGGGASTAANRRTSIVPGTGTTIIAIIQLTTITTTYICPPLNVTYAYTFVYTSLTPRLTCPLTSSPLNPYHPGTDVHHHKIQWLSDDISVGPSPGSAAASEMNEADVAAMMDGAEESPNAVVWDASGTPSPIPYP